MQSSPNPNYKSGSTTEKRAKRSGWFRRIFIDILFVAKRDQKWWLLPLIVLLLLMAALMGIAALGGPLAPFIYPLL